MSESTSGFTTPWYKTTRRWGQTNLTEIDPRDCDISFWRMYWADTHVQGVIVNAGGIVAYYPSTFEYHYRAKFLGDTDLLGDFVSAAREDGLAVLARMDSNRALPEFYKAHPDWFFCSPDGEPRIVQGRYQACVNSPYYREYIPDILREIIDRYHPDGFTDNSWSGVGRRAICHCPHCKKKFSDEMGKNLPLKPDWDDPVYRCWVRWSYTSRIELWDLFNQVTTEKGGKDCLWLGMVNGNPVLSHLNFTDLNEVGKRSKIIMTDHQSRDEFCGFEQNSLNGKLLHEVGGQDTLIPESLAMYTRGPQAFRRAAAPAVEMRQWIYSGISGGISPWWHHVGGHQEDRRQYETARPVMDWHKENEQYLYDRSPVATVGILWSHENTDFHGKDDGYERVLFPWRGFIKACIRARIPFAQVHADSIRGCIGRLSCLILPNLAVLSDDQCIALREFIDAGGSVVATGRSSLMDETGALRSDFGIADLFDCHHQDPGLESDEQHSSNWEVSRWHTYWRLNEKESPVFRGLGDTDIVAFGGVLQPVLSGGNSTVVSTAIPSFPIYPPEFSWMSEKDSDAPAIVTREFPSGGRLVYCAGDIDRCYGKRGLPDHGDLLKNFILWCLRDKLPVSVEGPGLVDVNLYTQENRFVLHLLNLTGANVQPGYLEENLPIGPLIVSLENAHEMRNAFAKVSGKELPLTIRNGKACFELPLLGDHEMVVVQ